MGLDTDFNQAEFNQEHIDPRTGDLKLCMGRVKCVHCGKPYGVCSEVEAELTQQEKNNMLPNSSRTSGGGGGNRAPRSGYTYITEADLSSDKVLAHINAVQLNSRELKTDQKRYSDLMLQVEFKGSTRLFGVKFFDDSGNKTPNFQIFLDAFGADENSWTGREFYIFAEKQEFTGRIFTRVECKEESGVKKGKK